MRFISIRRVGFILALIGIVLIGFFGLFAQELGQIHFPFVEVIQGYSEMILFFVPRQTLSWWNSKLIGLSLGIIGSLMMKYG